MPRIAAAILLLMVSGFCTVAFAHSGGGGHGHGGHRAAGHRNGGIGRGNHRSRLGGDRGGRAGDGWYSGRFYGGAGRWGYGLLVGSLPWYCDTYRWGGVAYFYADDNYYQWNSTAGAYETVQPPPGLVDQVQAESPELRELFIFPEAGQSNRQLARDREDCRRLAARQVGFDPANHSPAAGAASAPREDYLRAYGACLVARNYSVE